MLKEVDASQTTTTYTYEVQQFALRQEAVNTHFEQDVKSAVTRTRARNEKELLYIVSSLWIGKRVAGMGTETHAVSTTYDAFQPRAYDVQAARSTVAKYTASTCITLACAALWGISWPLVLALALWTYYSVLITTALPQNSFEPVTHDVSVEVPIEVAYYLDPTLPNPSTWGGPSYTRVVWEDGDTRINHEDYEKYHDALSEDPNYYLNAFDQKIGWKA